MSARSAGEFTAAIEALHPVAYALKFAGKSDLGRDYVVLPLEGLWWSQDLAAFTTARDKSLWQWTLMVMVPDWADADAFAAAVDRVGTKKAPAGTPHEICLSDFRRVAPEKLRAILRRPVAVEARKRAPSTPGVPAPSSQLDRRRLGQTRQFPDPFPRERFAVSEGTDRFGTWTHRCTCVT